MRKSVILAALVTVFGFGTARGAYLYWQVSGSDISGSGIKAANRAALVAVKGDTQVLLTGTTAAGGESGQLFELPVGEIAVSLDQLDNASEYSFFVEMFNYDASGDDSLIITGMSETMTYASLYSHSYIDTGLTPSGTPVIWHGSGYMIPEPACGLMALLGLGALSLRRRRKAELARQAEL